MVHEVLEDGATHKADGRLQQLGRHGQLTVLGRAQPLAYETLEAVRINVVRINLQDVTPTPPDDHVAPEEAAEVRNLRMEGVARFGGRSSPQTSSINRSLDTG